MKFIWNVVVNTRTNKILAVYGQDAYLAAQFSFKQYGRQYPVRLVIDVFDKMPIPGQTYHRKLN